MGNERPMVVDCRPLQEQIKAEIKNECKLLKSKPTLTIIRVGDDYASKKYVAQKVKHGVEAGIKVETIILDGDSLFEKVAEAIIESNKDFNVNGIILQLPLPEHLKKHEQELIDLIAPEKDVDCLTTINVGKLVHGNPLYTPCTPQGVIDILDMNNIELRGARVAIIGRSNIVGKPLIHMLLGRDARVTVYHSKCDFDEWDIADNNDIIISAVGKTKLWRFDRFDNKILIDVGINFDDVGKICGDIDLEQSLYKLATPVPNGVGRMTVSALLKNVLKAYKIQNKLI